MKNDRVPLTRLAEIAGKFMQGIAKAIPERFQIWIGSSHTPDIAARVVNIGPELMNKILHKYKFEPIDIAQRKAELLEVWKEFPIDLPEGASGKNYGGLRFNNLFVLAKILKLKIKYEIYGLDLFREMETESSLSFIKWEAIKEQIENSSNMTHKEQEEIYKEKKYRIANIEEVINWMLDVAILDSFTYNVNPAFRIFKLLFGIYHASEETAGTSIIIRTSTVDEIEIHRDGYRHHYSLLFDIFNKKIVLMTISENKKGNNIRAIACPIS